MQEKNKERNIEFAPRGWGRKFSLEFKLGYRKMVFPTVMVGAIACAIGMGSIVNKNTDTVYAIESKEVQSELSKQVKEVKKSKDSFDEKTKKLAEEKKAKEAAEQKAKEEQEKKEAEEKARQEEEAKQAQAQAQAQAEAEAAAAAQAQQAQAQTPVTTPSWNGSVLTPSAGVNYGPSGKETYYNLDMSGVVSIMRGMGNNDNYWVRGDGVKMLGDYVMVAANLNVHPRGSIVETSLGTGIVCDTGGFASGNATQLDIATSW